MYVRLFKEMVGNVSVKLRTAARKWTAKAGNGQKKLVPKGWGTVM
jgi:hypothetical protein